MMMNHAKTDTSQENPVLVFSTLQCSHGKSIGIARLNSEKTLNALSMTMVNLLTVQLTAWDQDDSIVMVLLESAGEKAFCAGGDLHQLYASMVQHHAAENQHDLLGNPYALEFFEHEYRLDYQIHTYRKPILCWAHGIVMGGGIGLMAGASHRVVTERSKLAMPEISIGLFPDVGGSWFLNRMPGKTGLFLALTGAILNPADAIFAKLADFELLHSTKSELLTQLQNADWSLTPAQNHLLLSRLLQSYAVHSIAQGPLRQHFDLINRLCEADELTEIIRRIVQLKSEDSWLSKAAATLSKGSPSSAWLAHALLNQCKHLSLAQVFQLELCAALACARASDFAEGIRALLIDKDLQPVWAAIDFNDPKNQERYLSPPWNQDTHPLRDLA